LRTLLYAINKFLVQDPIRLMSEKEEAQKQIDMRSQLEALLPAYAIGVTDPEETAFVERTLAGHPDLAADLADYADLGERLLYTAPPIEPPSTLEDNLRATLAEGATAGAAVATAIAPEKNQQGFWSQVRAIFNPGAWTPLGVAAAAAILLLLVMNGVWLMQINRLQTEQVALQAQLNLQERTLAMLTGATGGVEEVALHAAGDATSASASLRWDPQAQVAVLQADNFPELSPEQVYQLWLIQGDERTSGGLFTVNDVGDGVLVFTPPAPLETFNAFGITPEPAGGSDGPTSPPVALGQL